MNTADIADTHSYGDMDRRGEILFLDSASNADRCRAVFKVREHACSDDVDGRLVGDVTSGYLPLPHLAPLAHEDYDGVTV